MIRWAGVLVAVAMISLASPPAAAQTRAAAELAFREGRKLAAEGKYAEACARFEESQRLEPAAGTLINLADCYEKLDKVASAWSSFREVEEISRRGGDADRAAEAKRRAEALEPRLIRLEIAVTETVEGLEVTLDGKPATAVLDAPVPIDRGQHRIEARAPGRQPWVHTVDAKTPGRTEKVIVPRLEAIGTDGQPLGRPGETRGRRMTAMTWSLGAASAVALGVGLVFDITAYGDVRDCRDAGGCASDAERDRIHTRFVIGDVLIGTAVATGATAALLYWWSDERESGGGVSVSVTPDFQGLVVTRPF